MRAKWRIGRVPTPLMIVLQTIAFTFRHRSILAAPLGIDPRSAVSATVALPLSYGASNWSGCGVLPTGVRLPRPGLFLHELHPGIGHPTRIRTSTSGSVDRRLVHSTMGRPVLRTGFDPVSPP